MYIKNLIHKKLYLLDLQLHDYIMWKHSISIVLEKYFKYFWEFGQFCDKGSLRIK